MNTKNTYDIHFEKIRQKAKSLGLLGNTPVYGTVNISIHILLYLVGLFLLGKVHIVFMILYFYFVITQLLYISHDLMHNQYFKGSKKNKVLSYIIGNVLIGMSSNWWKNKHNVLHHSFTNSDQKDQDIKGFAKHFMNKTLSKKYIKIIKSFVFWLNAPAMYFNLFVKSFAFMIREKRFKELSVSLCSIFILPLILVLNYGFLMAGVFLLSLYLLCGVHLALAFMVNHVGMPVIKGGTEKMYSWLDIHTLTSRNIKGGVITNYLLGGLNKQIEHHIFPHVSRKNISKLSKMIREYCIENKIKYHEVNFFIALKEINTSLLTGKTI